MWEQIYQTEVIHGYLSTEQFKQNDQTAWYCPLRLWLQIVCRVFPAVHLQRLQIVCCVFPALRLQMLQIVCHVFPAHRLCRLQIVCHMFPALHLQKLQIVCCVFPALRLQRTWSLQHCGVALSSSASSIGQCLYETSLSP